MVVGGTREQGVGLAEMTMGFYQKNDRLPRSMQELPPECQGWVSSTVEGSDPDLFLDPRSNGDRACVWLRPKKGFARGEWIMAKFGAWEPGTVFLPPDHWKPLGGEASAPSSSGRK